jgi:hypothetical protein
MKNLHSLFFFIQNLLYANYAFLIKLFDKLKIVENKFPFLNMTEMGKTSHATVPLKKAGEICKNYLHVKRRASSRKD